MWREAGSKKTRQPGISTEAPHLLAEWHWEANEKHGWHLEQVTLGSNKKVHWVVQDECKLGLVHRWQASPADRTTSNNGSPFPSGMAVCACNSLAVQCPEAADLWDFASNAGLTPNAVAVHSHIVVAWKRPDGRQWQQIVQQIVKNMRRRSNFKQVGIRLFLKCIPLADKWIVFLVANVWSGTHRRVHV